MPIRAIVAVLSSLASCASPSARPEPSATPASATTTAADESSAVAAEATHHTPEQARPSATFRELLVEGFLPALLYVPAGSEPRPLVVATHGAGGGPEWECDYWHALTRGHAILLCLRGTPIDVRYPSGFYYKDHFALGREFRAALAAVNVALGARILQGAGLYAGFSQGAIMGAPMIVPHAEDFPRLALIEGGYEYWSPKGARDFARGGGKRVLFSCGTRWCKDKSEIPAQWLRKAGVEVRIEYASGAGHTPAGEVMTRTAAALPWLFEGEPGWITRSP